MSKTQTRSKRASGQTAGTAVAVFLDSERPCTFDPATAERTLHLGLSDSAELWGLPPLLRVLEREAPGIRIVAVPVQLRTVAAQLTSGLAAAITVADELPATIRRERLFYGGFTCLYDPRYARLRRQSRERSDHPSADEHRAGARLRHSPGMDLRRGSRPSRASGYS